MALGDYFQQLKQEKRQYQAAQEIYGIMAREGLNGVTGEALGAIGQKYELGYDGLKPVIDFLTQTGLAKEALQKSQTEVEQTRYTAGQANKVEQDARFDADLQPGRLEKQKLENTGLGIQNEGYKLKNEGQVIENTWKPKQFQAQIDRDNAAADSSRATAASTRAKTPYEIEKLKRDASSSDSSDRTNHVARFIQSVGVKPGTMVSNVKDGSVNFTEKYVTGEQARDIMAAAKQQGIAIKGQGVWDEAGNLTGFYMTSAVYDPATAATQRLVTKRPKAGAKPAAAPRPAAGKPVGNASSRVGGIPKRQPGESLADYLKRTGAY